MPTFAPREEEMLGLVVDEIWDLTSAMQELERRRDKLRDHVADVCRLRGIDRWKHARGTLRIDKYRSYTVKKVDEFVPYAQMLGWTRETLAVKGRALHKLAQADPKARILFDQMYPVVEHETLVMTPTKVARAGRRS